MQQQDSGARARVIAKVTNGAAYVLLATPTGLKWCLEKNVGRGDKWAHTPTLCDFIDAVRGGKDVGIEISASDDPNGTIPIRNRHFHNFSDFAASGFDFVSTGTMTVRVQEGVFAHQHR